MTEAKHQEFTMLPNEFIDRHLPRLTPSASVLATYVARHTLGRGQSNFCSSLKQISAGTGLGQRTIRRCESELRTSRGRQRLPQWLLDAIYNRGGMPAGRDIDLMGPADALNRVEGGR